MACLTANAQETYLNGNLLKPELNGTARYVGMGGAMEALGADISTIGTNPAGIGLFRRSAANISFGLMSQQDAPTIDGTNKTHASFDQAGFVYSTRTSSSSFLNFAFNYSKAVTSTSSWMPLVSQMVVVRTKLLPTRATTVSLITIQMTSDSPSSTISTAN